MNIYKLNKFWIGLFSGIIIPLIGMIIYYYLELYPARLSQVLPLFEKENIHISIITFFVIFNLVFFHFSINKKIYQFSKGIVSATAMYVIFLAWLYFK